MKDSKALAAASLSSPSDASPAFASALNAADLEAATACFTRDACLLTADATAVSGRGGIRLVLRQLIAMGAVTQIEQRSILAAGDIALATERWSTRFCPVEGKAFVRSSTATAVVRRVEGAWKLQIIAPWGQM